MLATEILRELLAPGAVPGAKVRERHLAGRLDIAAPVCLALGAAKRRTLGLPRLDPSKQIPRLGALKVQEPPSRLGRRPRCATTSN